MTIETSLEYELTSIPLSLFSNRYELMSWFPFPYRCSATKIWADSHPLIVFQQQRYELIPIHLLLFSKKDMSWLPFLYRYSATKIWADSHPLIAVQQQRYELNPTPLSLFSKKDMSWLPSSYRCPATKIWADSHPLIVVQQQRYELTPISLSLFSNKDMSWLPSPYRCSATKIIKWTRRKWQTFPTLAWRIWPSRMISLTNHDPVRWLMADDFSTWWSRNKFILGRKLSTVTLTTYSILAVDLKSWLWYSMVIATQRKIMITSMVPRTYAVSYKFDRTWYIWSQRLSS